MSDEIPFITDDDAARELRSIANGLHDLHARVPSLARRLEAVADRLCPSGRNQLAGGDVGKLDESTQTTLGEVGPG